jgi:hypothetical protein
MQAHDVSQRDGVDLGQRRPPPDVEALLGALGVSLGIAHITPAFGATGFLLA